MGLAGCGTCTSLPSHRGFLKCLLRSDKIMSGPPSAPCSCFPLNALAGAAQLSHAAASLRQLLNREQTSAMFIPVCLTALPYTARVTSLALQPLCPRHCDSSHAALTAVGTWAQTQGASASTGSRGVSGTHKTHIPFLISHPPRSENKF